MSSPGPPGQTIERGMAGMFILVCLRLESVAFCAAFLSRLCEDDALTRHAAALVDLATIID